MKISFLLFIGPFLVRTLRWLGFVQQKEYRLDRLKLFLKSLEGQSELKRIFPKKKDFSRSGLKRPKITARSVIVGLVFSVVFIILFSVLIIVALSVTSILSSFLIIISGLFILLFTIPFIVFLSVMPTTVIASVRTYFELLKASKRLKKGNPIIVGITGSYGKTSTKLFLSHVLSKKFSVFKTPKSFNTKFSVANSIAHGYFDQDVAILEYAAYKKGEIKNLANWFKPNMAVITGLTEQHLGLFGSLPAIIQAKSELVSSLKRGSVVICNGYDKGTLRIFETAQRNDLELISIDEQHNQIKIFKAHLNKKGELIFVWNGQQVLTKLLGMHYLEIVQMVIAVSSKLGLTDEQIVSGLSDFIPDDKFIFSYKLGSGTLVVDDGGTSNPKGFEAAISLAENIDADKKILITPGILDLGLRSNDIHSDLAKRAKKVFSNVLYVGEIGSKQFDDVFESKFINSQIDVQKEIASMGSDNLVLVEGRMPVWLKEVLK